MDNTLENKWLYEATTVNTLLSSLYDTAMEMTFISIRGLAPKLQVVTLPGNWRAMIMEKVDGKQFAEEDLEVVRPKLLELQAALKEQKFVHGDLRPQNIMVSSEKRSDCCGFRVSGSATYPKEINLSPECKWHEDVECGGVIYHEHDDFETTWLEAC